MPKKNIREKNIHRDNVPKRLRPYIFHGLDLDWESGRDELVTECPWCGKEKFAVNAVDGGSHCWSCAEAPSKGKGFNPRTFVEHLWWTSVEATGVEDYKSLARDRGLLYPDTLFRWGLCRSIITGSWLLPSYSETGELKQVYRYGRTNKGRYAALPTSGLYPRGKGHYLFGVSLYNSECTTVYLCEGIWDAMALWELLGSSKGSTGEGLRETANPERSLLADSSVLAVPSCSVFKAEWSTLFGGKDVCILFDNDHPSEGNVHEGNVHEGNIHEDGKEPAAVAGTRRIAGILAQSREPPAQVRRIQWGPKGYDPTLPNGHDVRDLLAGSSTP